MRKPERLRSQPVRSVDQAVELAEAEREMRFSQRVDALAEAMGSPADLSVRNLADGVAAVYLTTMVDAEGPGGCDQPAERGSCAAPCPHRAADGIRDRRGHHGAAVAERGG